MRVWLWGVGLLYITVIGGTVIADNVIADTDIAVGGIRGEGGDGTPHAYPQSLLPREGEQLRWTFAAAIELVGMVDGT